MSISITTIVSLPPELLLTIFSFLDDLDDLKSFAKSRYSLFQIYAASKTEINSQVLANFLPAEIFEHARAAVAVSCLSRFPKSNILKLCVGKSLLDISAGGWLPLQACLTSPAAIRVHRHVHFFTNLVFESASRQAHEVGVNRPDETRPLDQEEYIRTMRSLYNYHFICTLAQIDDEMCRPHNTLNSGYWAKTCTVWEMEELGCIYDILAANLENHADVLGPIVEECRNFFSLSDGKFVAVDPTRSWGKLCVEQARRYLMLLGLPFHYRLATASTDLERQRIVQTQCLDARTMIFTHRSFQEVACAVPRDRLRDATIGSVAAPSAGWLFANKYRVLKAMEDDDGPDQDRLRFSLDYYSDDFAAPRRWGYCLWSRARLEEWGVLQAEDRLAAQENEVAAS